MDRVHVEEPNTVDTPTIQDTSTSRYNLRPRNPKANISTLEPKTFKEALNCNDRELWKNAMNEEIDSFIMHNIWELVNKPIGKNIVKNPWIFSSKHDAEGNIIRYKSRLVAKGFTEM